MSDLLKKASQHILNAVVGYNVLCEQGIVHWILAMPKNVYIEDNIEPYHTQKIYSIKGIYFPYKDFVSNIFSIRISQSFCYSCAFFKGVVQQNVKEYKPWKSFEKQVVVGINRVGVSIFKTTKEVCKKSEEVCRNS